MPENSAIQCNQDFLIQRPELILETNIVLLIYLGYIDKPLEFLMLMRDNNEVCTAFVASCFWLLQIHK